MFSFVLKRSMTSATSGFSQGTSKFVMFAHERSLKFLSDVDQTLKEIEESNEKCKKLGLNHYFLKLLTSEIDKVLINPNEIDALLSPLIKGNPGCCGISASVPYKLTAESSLSSNLVKNLTRIAVHLRKMTPNDQPLSMNIGLGIGKNELSEVENESADVHFAESIRNTTKICTDLFRDSLEYSVLFGVDKTMGNGEFTRKHFEILHESMPGEAMMAYNFENASLFDSEGQEETQMRQLAKFLFPKNNQVGNIVFGKYSIASFLELQMEKQPKRIKLVNLRNSFHSSIHNQIG